jgi:hypothetical protein
LRETQEPAAVRTRTSPTSRQPGSVAVTQALPQEQRPPDVFAVDAEDRRRLEPSDDEEIKHSGSRLKSAPRADG